MDKFNRILIERRFCRLAPPEGQAVSADRRLDAPAIAMALIGFWVGLFLILIWTAL